MARKPALVTAHWHRYVEGFSTSAMAFYALVEESITRRELPGVVLSRVEFKEGGVFSARREYLRIRRQRVVFDLCAAPYGKDGYFFSWRVGDLPRNLVIRLLATLAVVALLPGFVRVALEKPSGTFLVLSLLAALTVVLGAMATKRNVERGAERTPPAPLYLGWLWTPLSPPTYYRIDTALVFQEAVQASVEEVLDGLLSQQGLRALCQYERPPRPPEIS